MTTVEDLAGETLALVNGEFRPNYDLLVSTITDSETTLELTNDTWSLTAGDWIEIDAEPMMVVSKDGELITVVRGQSPYTAAAHTAGALISIKPIILKADVMRHLKAEIESLPNTIFGVEAADVVFPINQTYAELDPANVPITVVAAWKDPDEAVYDPVRKVNLRVIQDLDTGVSSTGYLVQTAPVPGYFSNATTVRVVTSYRFVTTGWALTLDLDSLGITQQVQSIIQYGAAFRLMMSRASARTQLDVQGPGRNAEEVPANAAVQLAESYRRTRAQLIALEASRLRQPYGIAYQ